MAIPVQILTLIFLCSTIALATAQSESIYELLPKIGLPRGLLPEAVKSYSLSSNGDFAVELTSTCYVHFSRLVYYDKKITGKVSYGKIKDITGIEAKKFFVWVSVTGIEARLDKGEIDFEVGILSETLDSREFEEIKKCEKNFGCGRGKIGILDGGVGSRAEA